MNPYHTLLSNIAHIEARLGLTFRNKRLLALAFVHPSFTNEHRDIVKEDNERLEFLGDGVLNMLAAEYLYYRFPRVDEGILSSHRSLLVAADACALYIKTIDIARFLLLGRGEKQNLGHLRNSILADLMEAILGAIFLDQTIEGCRVFFPQLFEREIEELLHRPEGNWKALLQDWAQKQGRRAPFYEILSENGPDHKKTFTVACSIDDTLLARAEGNSKKRAEQQAAQKAFETLMTIESR